MDKKLDIEFLARLAVPVPLRAEILEAYHDDIFGGHLGYEKTLEKISARFYWPFMSSDVRDYCARCHMCSTRKGPKHFNHVGLHSTSAKYLPFQRVSVDIVGPLRQSTEGHKWLIVFVNAATRWPEVVPTKDVTAQTVAKVFLDAIVSRHGAPLELMSDRGSNFLSAVVQSICDLCNTRKRNTCAYSPATNGLCENFNKTLINMLSMYCNKLQDDWHIFIPFCLFAYRTSVQRSTGYTPAQLVYGRELRQPLEVGLPHPRHPDILDDEDITQMARLALTEARNMANQNTELAQNQQKQQHEKSVKPRKFETGEQIYLYTPVHKKGFTHKLFHEFHGPYTIVAVFLPRIKVQLTDKPAQEPFWVHSSRVKPSHLPKIAVPRPSPPTSESPFQPHETPNEANTKSATEIQESPATDSKPEIPAIGPNSKADNDEWISDEEEEVELGPANKPRRQRTKKPRFQRSTTATHGYNLRKNPAKKVYSAQSMGSAT